MKGSHEMTQVTTPWRISSFCATLQCVEVTQTASGDVAYRDRNETVLTLSRKRHETLIGAIKGGKYNFTLPRSR